jgi:hypothetical protein
MTLFHRRPKPRIRPAARAIASRAIFAEASGMLPTIQMTFELVSGEVVTFELQVNEAGKFIEQATSAYRAIVPPLRTGMQGWGA